MPENSAKLRTISYLRVSTQDQDLEKNKADVLTFANNRDFGKVEFVEEKISGKVNWKQRKIKGIIDDLGQGSRLIVPELTRLGRSTLEVLEILKEAKTKALPYFRSRKTWN
jgi:DNA invertase Pin-like site-specific DNA recombinase